jgi:hypothetical protein
VDPERYTLFKIQNYSKFKIQKKIQNSKRSFEGLERDLFKKQTLSSSSYGEERADFLRSR